MKKGVINFLTKPTHIAPLSVFRIVFAAVMFFSILRFIWKGWVHDLYVAPDYFFSYYGFEWVQPMSEPFLYLLFVALAISFLLQTLGLFYRFASVFSFFAFTYIELLDKSNYLNHYYFVSIVCLLLIFVPAHRYFSLDVYRNPKLKLSHVPNYFIFLFQLQLAIVYFYAGMAKLNYDWLVNALPLKIWLPSKSNLPLLGFIVEKEWVAYLFSWAGALYDLVIPFLLFTRKFRPFAYLMVVVFHLLTYALFQIGMFPFIMIGATLIFFSEDFHLKLIHRFNQWLKLKPAVMEKRYYRLAPRKATLLLLSFFFGMQLITPFRYLLYPGNLYWTEEGYRFSWRVMLMEKAGYAIFHVKDTKSKRSWEVNNNEFLTPNQEKMMSTQPDMLLQFAHHLEDHYQEKGLDSVEIRAEVYVTLNGNPSKLFIDPSIDLTQLEESFAHKEWILPFKTQKQ